MNLRHSKVTNWGLSNIEVQKQELVLDVEANAGGYTSAWQQSVSVQNLFFSKTELLTTKPGDF
jgi:C-terminal processing protease CtpA/Prc